MGLITDNKNGTTLTAKQILGMDSHFTLNIGVSALQKILKTLSKYVKEVKTLKDRNLEYKEENLSLKFQRTELQKSNAILIERINSLENQTFSIRTVNSINLCDITDAQ